MPVTNTLLVDVIVGLVAVPETSDPWVVVF